MRKLFIIMTGSILLALCLSGCSGIDDKSTTISFIYGITSVFSFLLLIAYFRLFHQKNLGFLLLFSSVLVVNIGYFSLSVSQTLNQALMFNRLSYLGSVFLPMAMLMILFNVANIKCPRWISHLLFVIGGIVFLIAASPGYLDIYYKEVSLTTVNGVSILNKVYGPFHCIYLFYLILYFVLMVSVSVYAIKTKKVDSVVHSVILLIAVFVNMAVWLLEQLVTINFEFLSVSYIISELFLLGLYLMMQENNRLLEQTKESLSQMAAHPPKDFSPVPELLAKCDYFTASLPSLTPTEHIIYDLYLEGKTTKEILALLNIKENTLKYHNKNIYSKLGVSSRKQLIEIAHILQTQNQ